MNSTSHTERTLVIAATAVIVILAILLGFRLHARSNEADLAPAATLAETSAADISNLEIPCWSCREATDWPLTFKTDLDLLAPLGTGTGNAADWFKDFSKPDGARYREAVAAMKRRVDHPTLNKVLPADDPLLLEAEPWCDQATMHFYPEIYPIEGFETKIPNLLVQLAFVKSWVARGMTSEDPIAAMEDFQRAIRLGRLLRQDDTTIIADLVGLVCIRIGAEAIYELAVERGELELALVASVVVGEVAPQRLLTSERVTRTVLTTELQQGSDGRIMLELPDERLDEIIKMASTEHDRRFQGEVTTALNIVRFLGTAAQQQRALSALEPMLESDDPIVAAMARCARDNAPDEKLITEHLGL